jgi:putative transposase
LRSLKRRGLAGVRLVISDQHAGLVAAIGRCFQGAAHQRCRVHLARNLMSTIPKGHQEMVSAAFRTIFAQVSPDEISAQWDHVQTMLTERFDKAAALMGRAKEEVLAFGAFPRVHWRQIWSTNPLVIYRQLEGVHDVADVPPFGLSLGAGRGYLQPSNTQARGRFGVRSAGGVARFAA